MTFAPRTRRLKAEDYPGAPVWLSDLLRPVNALLVDLSANLGRQSVAFKTLQLTAADPLESGFPVTLSHGLDALPVAVQVCGGTNLTDARAVFFDAPYVTWELSPRGDLVVVRHISGLQSGNRYLLTLRVEA